MTKVDTFWQFLAIFDIFFVVENVDFYFDNFDFFDNFEFWHYLTIFDHVDNFWQFWTIFDNYDIFYHFDYFWQFRDFFDKFYSLWQILFFTFLQCLTIWTTFINFTDCDKFCFYHFTMFDHLDNLGDLWHWRHWLKLWQLGITIYDNLYNLTIKSDTGHDSICNSCDVFVFHCTSSKYLALLACEVSFSLVKSCWIKV